MSFEWVVILMLGGQFLMLYMMDKQLDSIAATLRREFPPPDDDEV